MKFVGVTACPTGIAHSAMAAEALETAAKEKGHDIGRDPRGLRRGVCRPADDKRRGRDHHRRGCYRLRA